jgi:tetratricopeptide (TPR) repeat protein
VTAQLIDVANGYHLWSETYDRSVEDIFAVQDEIARKIAERLQVEISGEAQKAVRTRPVNMEAHELYLQGRHYWNQRGKDNLEKAAQLFKQAIDKDPTHAAAFAGLGATYALLPDYAQRPAADYFPLAQAAAAKALELDSSSAEALTVLAQLASCSLDGKRAEDQFKQALRLNPNYATAHHWYGILLRETGRLEQATTELERAEELDPLSPIIKVNRLMLYCYTRRFDEGIRECQKHLQVFPDFPLLHTSLGFFYMDKGMYSEALEEHKKARSLQGAGLGFLDAVAHACARSGDEAQARKILAELEDAKSKGYAVNGQLAFTHLGLREYDRAISYLEQALDAHEEVTGLLYDPLLDELRSHPRFEALLRKARLK